MRISGVVVGGGSPLAARNANFDAALSRLAQADAAAGWVGSNCTGNGRGSAMAYGVSARQLVRGDEAALWALLQALHRRFAKAVTGPGARTPTAHHAPSLGSAHADATFTGASPIPSNVCGEEYAEEPQRPVGSIDPPSCIAATTASIAGASAALHNAAAATEPAVLHWLCGAGMLGKT